MGFGSFWQGTICKFLSTTQLFCRFGAIDIATFELDRHHSKLPIFLRKKQNEIASLDFRMSSRRDFVHIHDDSARRYVFHTHTATISRA